MILDENHHCLFLSLSVKKEKLHQSNLETRIGRETKQISKRKTNKELEEQNQ